MHDVRDAVSSRDARRFSTIARHPPLMIGFLAALDAALFTAIGALHLGASIGELSAPQAHWVAPIELFAAGCLVISAGAVLTRAGLAREIAVIGNGVALLSVFLGVFAFSVGLDPCTPITDVHYGITAAVTFLSIWRLSRWQKGLPWPP